MTNFVDIFLRCEKIWIYFLIFILLTAITLLNVMVGIVVEAVGTISAAVKERQAAEAAENAPPEERRADEIKAEIRQHLAQIEALLEVRKDEAI